MTRPELQDRDPVADIHDEPDDVLDQDERDALLIADPAQQRVELGEPIDAQSHGGLVEQNDLRIADQRAGDLDHALLAEGQCSRGPIREVRHADEMQCAARLLLRAHFLLAPATQAEAGAEKARCVCRCRPVIRFSSTVMPLNKLRGLEGAPKPKLRDVARLAADDRGSVEPDAPLLRTMHAADRVQQRGLAGAVGPDQPANLEPVDIEVDALQHVARRRS